MVVMLSMLLDVLRSTAKLMKSKRDNTFLFSTEEVRVYQKYPYEVISCMSICIGTS